MIYFRHHKFPDLMVMEHNIMQMWLWDYVKYTYIFVSRDGISVIYVEKREITNRIDNYRIALRYSNFIKLILVNSLHKVISPFYYNILLFRKTTISMEWYLIGLMKAAWWQQLNSKKVKSNFILFSFYIWNEIFCEN